MEFQHYFQIFERFSRCTKPRTVILANDFHSTLETPNRWMQLKYSCDNINAIGLSLPGVPFLFSGRNDKISWGITNMKADDADYVIQEMDSTGRYILENKDSLEIKTKLELVVDTINIADKKPYIYFKRVFNKKPIITGNIFRRENISKFTSQNKFYRRYSAQVLWTGNYKSHEILSLYQITKARNKVDFSNALHFWSVPCSIFGYGDVYGQYGIQAAGKIPIRNEMVDPLLPIKYSKYLKPWKSLVNLSNISLFNDELDSNEFVLAANNPLFKTDSIYIGYFWDNPYRGLRIAEILFNSDGYNAKDAQVMQNDIYSLYAKEMLDICMPVWEKHKDLLNSIQKQSLDALKTWNYILSSESYEALIFQTFLERMIFNTFKDEMGSNIFNKYLFFNNLTETNVLFLLKYNAGSQLFDDKTTLNSENAYFFVFKSYMEAINLLVKKFNSKSPQDWKYGYINRIHPRHYLSYNELYADAVNMDIISIGGSATTITNITRNKYGSSGATMRFISDMGEDFIYTIIPGGNSGNPISPFYSNQYQLWQNNAYVSTSIQRNPKRHGFKKNLEIIKK